MVDVDRFGFTDLWAPYFKGHANDFSVQSHSLKADHPCFLWTRPFQERLSLEYSGSQVTVRFPFQTSPSRDVPGTGAPSSSQPAMSLDVAWLNGWIGEDLLRPSTKKTEDSDTC